MVYLNLFSASEKLHSIHPTKEGILAIGYIRSAMQFSRFYYK